MLINLSLKVIKYERCFLFWNTNVALRQDQRTSFLAINNEQWQQIKITFHSLLIDFPYLKFSVVWSLVLLYFLSLGTNYLPLLYLLFFSISSRNFSLYIFYFQKYFSWFVAFLLITLILWIFTPLLFSIYFDQLNILKFSSNINNLQAT